MTCISSVVPRVSFSSVCSLLFVALMVLLPVRANAQAVYGSVSGIITDPSGGVIPGATVTITSVERKTVRHRRDQRIRHLPEGASAPGTYEVKAELQGFKSAVFPAIRVNVDTQTPLNIKLEAGAVSESVTVAGFSPVLKTDRADVATTFDSKQINDLPVLDRNFTKFILLTPGTQQLGWQHAASENPQGSTQTMVNGQNFSGTGYQLDGTDNRDPILGIIVINPNFEAIGETKITSQNYDAEFGQATAGVVSIQTRSGTNDLHGSGFEFYPEGRPPGAKPLHAIDEELADRTIPAGDEKESVRRIARRPDPEGSHVHLRRLPGHAQQRRRLAASERSDTGGPQRRSQRLRHEHLRSGWRAIRRSARSSPTTRFPSGRLNPQAQALLKLIPLPNLPGTDNGTRDNFVASGSELFNNDTFDARVDGRVSEPSERLRSLQLRRLSGATDRRRSGKAAALRWSRWAGRQRCGIRAWRPDSTARSAPP